MDPAHLSAMFMSRDQGQYNPLVLLTLAVEYRFFGLDPFFYHLTNVLLHVFNVLLAYLVFNKLSGRALVAGITALLFAVHPIAVEPVAWISSRKDLLYAFFYLGAFYAYLSYLEKGRFGAYLASFVLFILSALSKPMALSLPIVFCLVHAFFYFNVPFSWKRIAPFVIVAAMIGSMTLDLHPTTGAGLSPWMSGFPPLLKLVNFSYAPLFYISKLLWPAELAIVHPYSAILTKSPFLFVYAPLILVAFSGALLILVLRRRAFFAVFGILFFVVSLLPTLPIYFFSMTVYSEKYAYLASLGIFFIAAVLVDRSFSAKGLSWVTRTAVAAGLAAVTVLAGQGAYYQCGVWKNSFTVFANVLAIYPDTAYAYLKIADYCAEKGAAGKAIEYYDRAIELKPSGQPHAYHNRGVMRFLRGEYEAALSDMNLAIADDPGLSTSSLSDRRKIQDMVLKGREPAA